MKLLFDGLLVYLCLLCSFKTEETLTGRYLIDRSQYVKSFFDLFRYCLPEVSVTSMRPEWYDFNQTIIQLLPEGYCKRGVERFDNHDLDVLGYLDAFQT